MRRTWLAAALVLLLVSGGGPRLSLPAGGSPTGTSRAELADRDVALPPSVRPAWYTPVSGRISSQALVAQDVPVPGQRTVYVATSKASSTRSPRTATSAGGSSSASSTASASRSTATASRARASSTRRRARSTSSTRSGGCTRSTSCTGAERAGWPVRLYTDYWERARLGRDDPRERLAVRRHGLVLRPSDGREGDPPRPGTRGRSPSWVSVPLRLGGGGSVWGGAVSPTARERGSSSSRPGTRSGGLERRQALPGVGGYGEHVVELSLDLKVRARTTRPQMKGRDIGFVGSPVIFRHRFCGQLVAAVNKDGFLYVWRAEGGRRGRSSGSGSPIRRTPLRCSRSRRTRR